MEANTYYLKNKLPINCERMLILNIIEVIKRRRSIRQYVNHPLEDETIKMLLEAAISAPSGKNGQPWKFSVVNNSDDINHIAKLSVCYRWMRKAKCFIIVYLDKSCSYHYIKDIQSCGAAIQNILLAAYSMKIGSCWVGELMEKGEEIKSLLGINSKELEVMGIVTLGYSDKYSDTLNRRELESFIVRGYPKL